MALTSASRASTMHCLDVIFMVKSEDTYIFTFHKLHKSWKKGKASSKQYFYKYPKDQELCVGSALNEYLNCTETWRTNRNKFQLILTYIKPHVVVHISIASRSMKEILQETGVDIIFLKVTLHFQPLPQKHLNQVFQWMIYLVEDHGQMNLPGKNIIINKCFQRSNFFMKGY